MSKLLKIAGLVLLAGFAVSEASAHPVHISGTHSRGEIASACAAVGGMAGNTNGKSGSYSCTNLDKGTSVECTDAGKCTGWVPD